MKIKNKSFLPDLCGIKTLLTVIIVAQLLAFVLVLAAMISPNVRFGWHKLGLVSLFVHWVSLTSLSILCLLRKRLAAYSNLKAGVISYLSILLTTFLMSMIVAELGDSISPVENKAWVLIFALRNMAISAIVAAIALRFTFLHYQQNLANQAQSMARIQALQARIRPHFLFNSMNTIAALIRTQPEHAEEAVEDLADLFRSSLGEAHQMVSLESELNRVKKYLHIESLRLGKRLKVTWDLQLLPTQAKLPPLILQPLFENAVYHGIEPLSQGGTIDVKCTVDIDDNQVTLVINNPLPEEKFSRPQGSHIAMENIRERLQYTFGDAGKLYLVRKKDIVSVILTFPVVQSEIN